MRKIVIVLNIVLFVVGTQAVAQQLEKEITYSQFLERIEQQNLSYAAEKYKLPLATAEVIASGMRVDPTLNTKWIDNGDKQLKSGYGFEATLEWEVALSGKRKARTQLAKSEQAQVVYEVQAFFEDLRAQATVQYAAAIKNKRLQEIQEQSYKRVYDLAQSDSLRYTLGQISKVASVQSALEAKMMKHEWHNATVEWHNSLEELKVLLGNSESSDYYIPQGSLENTFRLFDLEKLLEQAPHVRAAYLATEQQQLVADSGVKAAQAERGLDLGLNVGVESDAFFNNVVVPHPTGTLLTFGVAIPLKFSNAKNADLKIAKINQEQSHVAKQIAWQALRKEIIQAFRDYSNKLSQKQSFETDMLEQAKEVLDGHLYSYKRGASSLLELLEAQRVYNEIQQNYVETLFDCTTALVELERAAGIWDIEL